MVGRLWFFCQNWVSSLVRILKNSRKFFKNCEVLAPTIMIIFLSHNHLQTHFKVRSLANGTKTKKRMRPRTLGVEGIGPPSLQTPHPAPSQRNRAPGPAPLISRSRGRRIGSRMIMILTWMISPCWMQVQSPKSLIPLFSSAVSCCGPIR